ncbi:MAG: tetratricopeptide repeat protein [Labilithrix sp.]|nr:tetratricopeptide repeat protein [Labilithrix sp.]
MRSRRRLPLLWGFSFVLVVPGAAIAAPQGGAPGPARSSSQFTLHREEAGGVDGNTARQRARAGDCAGALPSFDAAIRVTIEPTLRRDRGLCHEKLQHPFPAIEDYRAYLTSRPDAPDADQIRDRLARLEESVGIGALSSQQVRDREQSSGMSGSITVGSDGATSGGALGPREGEQQRSFDYYATQERLADAAESSPLRFGTGFAIGPYLQLPRYFFTGGQTSDFGFAIGASFRYSFGPVTSFLLEIGYAGFGTAGEGASQGGPQTFLGFEFRVPLDRWASNQIYLGLGPGYERYGTATNVASNVIAARGRLGYRHVFGPQVGLEIGADGGAGVAIISGLPPPQPGVNVDDTQGIGLISGNVAFVVGF